MYYRRAKTGGTYSFTVNLAGRQSYLLVCHIDNLRMAIRKVKIRHPFAATAMVALPEHLHAIWRLPPYDAGYPMRIFEGRFLSLTGTERRDAYQSSEQAYAGYLEASLL